VSDSLHSENDEVIGRKSAKEYGLISKGEKVNKWNKGSEDMDVIMTKVMRMKNCNDGDVKVGNSPRKNVKVKRL
jgi:hypothetical protein